MYKRLTLNLDLVFEALIVLITVVHQKVPFCVSNFMTPFKLMAHLSSDRREVPTWQTAIEENLSSNSLLP